MVHGGLSSVVKGGLLPASSRQGTPMGDLPAFHASRDPKRAVITMNEVSVSREDFSARVNRRARLLQAHGVTEGDFVTMGLANGFEIYETAFAIWKLGATPNVVSHRLPAPEISAIIDLLRPKLVIGFDPALTQGAAAIPAATSAENYSAEPLPTRVSTYWKAMTSGGSTGRPKIIVDHMPSVWDPNLTAYGQIVDDVALNPGPMYHNAPFSLIHLGVFAGAHVVEMGKFDAHHALELIEKHRIQWVNFVPTMMNRIWRLPDRAQFDVSSLRVMFHMASACPVWLKQNFIDWLGPERVWELYAGTERQGGTIISGAEWLAHKGSVGRLQPGSSMRIVNEAGAQCAPGEVGEIYFLPDGGRNSTYHYLGAEPRAKGEWESLGDLGYLDDEGYLYIVDRRTDMIVSGGANIYPAEIEAVLDAHPAVQSSIVIGLPHEDLGHAAHAIIQPAHGKDALDVEELKGFLADRIAKYKIPRSFEFVTEPLRDDAGKARRSGLRQERLEKLKG
ncbi:MAG TPA: AMP-binding protein [Caulobacterales bacterium]|nr:AMP-binding protein [Caulobacterales bacterium]